MTDNEKGDEAEGGMRSLNIADSKNLDWSCRLMGVERIIADPEHGDSEKIFAVKFQVDGPDANAEVDVIVSDASDPEVVAVAFHTLHVALTNWAKLIENRRVDLLEA